MIYFRSLDDFRDLLNNSNIKKNSFIFVGVILNILIVIKWCFTQNLFLFYFLGVKVRSEKNIEAVFMEQYNENIWLLKIIIWTKVNAILLIPVMGNVSSSSSLLFPITALHPVVSDGSW